MRDNEWTAILPGKGVVFNPSFIGLIGISLNKNGVSTSNENGTVETNHPDIAEVELDLKLKDRTRKHGFAVIYAYVYDGHVYTLDSPKIMAVPWGADKYADVDPGLLPGFGVIESEGSSGAKSKSSKDDKPRGLKIWPITKHHQVVEISISVGPAEALILESNLPGNRTANSYRSTMQIATSHSRLG